MHRKKQNKIILVNFCALNLAAKLPFNNYFLILGQTSKQMLIALNRVRFPASIFFLANCKNKLCLGNYPRKKCVTLMR